MDTQLTDLMHRATENLEPVTADLLERSVEQGLRLRRRRTTMLTVSGAGAVLATAGLIAGGIQAFGNSSSPAVAGQAVPLTAEVPAAKPGPVTPKETLATLRTFAEKRGKLSKPETWGDAKDGFVAAAYVVDDGQGASRVDVMVSGGGERNPCETQSAGCTKLADGSTLIVLSEQPEYPDSRQKEFGVVSNYVTLFRPDGRSINLTSYNGPAEKGQQHTRKHPLFSTSQLAAIAKSKAWKLPPVSTVKPTGKVKPTR